MVEPLHINPITLRMLGCYIVPVDTKSQEDQQIWSSATKDIPMDAIPEVRGLQLCRQSQLHGDWTA